VKWKGVLFLFGGLAIGVGLGLMVFFTGQTYTAAQQAKRSGPPTVGTAAPDFTLPLLDGSSQRLSDLQGNPVIINFWATWCIPCKEEMPLLEKVSKQYAGKLLVFGVNVGEGKELVTPFIEEVGVTFPILLDETQQVADLYFVRNFPITFFIDDSGMIRAMHIGTLQESQIERYLSTIGINP